MSIQSLIQLVDHLTKEIQNSYSIVSINQYLISINEEIQRINKHTKFPNQFEIFPIHDINQKEEIVRRVYQTIRLFFICLCQQLDNTIEINKQTLNNASFNLTNKNQYEIARKTIVEIEKQMRRICYITEYTQKLNSIFQYYQRLFNRFCS